MPEKYLTILNELQFDKQEFIRYKKMLLTHDYNESNEGFFSWVSCVLALKAASEGNLGVGAILVQDDLIIHEACNQMLSPYYRSDAHPEMMVLSDYESSHHVTPGSMKALKMYTSLEPCPMCLTRVCSTGIGSLKYVASHPGSGMAKHIDKLPQLWQIFSEDIEISEANCSYELKKVSYEIINISAKIHVPRILTCKEGSYPENKMNRYIENL